MKSNIPFLGTPAGYVVTAIVMVTGYTAGLVAEPMARPGLLEVLVAVGYGIPAGRMVAKWWIRFLSRVAEEVPSRPWLKWVGHMVYPMPPLGAQTSFRFILFLAHLLGIGSIWLTLLSASIIMHGLCEPWTRLGTLTVWEDTAITWILYFLVWLGTVSVIGWRWYNSLPD